MNEPLFRPEVVDASKSKMIGTVAIYSPPWRWLMISVVAIIAVSVAGFFIFGSYTKRESAQGELLPSRGVITLIPQTAGTVTGVNVAEGESVRKGAVLMEISSGLSTSQGGTWETVIEQIRVQRSRLKNEILETLALNEETMKGLRSREAILQQQIKQLALLLPKKVRQEQLAQRQLDKQRMMQQEGYASAAMVEQQENSVLEASSAVQELKRQQLEQHQQAAQIAQQLQEQPLNIRNQIHELEVRLSSLEQSLAENESRRSVTLRAPQNGTIGTVLPHVGQVVSAGQSVISLLPENSKLEARMLVSSRAIGFIQPGQRVVLRYQAFPYQKFGQQYGRVKEVSRTALTPQDIAGLTGSNNVNEQQYRVLVSLDKQHITAYGKQEMLRPGMAVEADFLIENRRLIEWVLEPLFALAKRSIDG